MTQEKLLSKKQKTLLKKMWNEPDGKWYRGNGTARQGSLRTLWSLEKRGLVRFLRDGERATVGLFEFEGCGWILTPEGQKLAQELPKF